MSDQMRILVVEDDEQLNQGIVNSLRKDGYVVQGVRSGAEAIRMVWLDEYDVVIGDLKTPGADGFELLQWLRAYRPKTRMIMVTAFGSPETRSQALEAGVAGYLEKPLNLHLLKEELRRLLQQTGFSANLDSFDLLDVIQIITMSRKNIALLVNTGLEERGVLRFQGGELIWAEYGILRGEEAFFALAAYKNGTVIHQPWNEQITPNVTQPLARLILQALQYRAKYAMIQQPTGEHEAIRQSMPLVHALDNDSPFMVLAEGEEDSFMAGGNRGNEQVGGSGNGNGGDSRDGNSGGKEWWQPSEKIPAFNAKGNHAENVADTGVTSKNPRVYGQTPTNGINKANRANRADGTNGSHGANSGNSTPDTVHKTPGGQREDLPSWLTEQPTMADMSMLRPSALSNTARVPTSKPPPAVWQPTTPSPQGKTTDQLPRKQATGPQKTMTKSGDMGNRRTGSPEWQPPAQTPTPSGPLQSIVQSRRVSDGFALTGQQESGPLSSTGALGTPRAQKRNYPALVAALQTLGYGIPGFVAAAVVNLDGQPIAQVAVDDLDIAHMCGYFSTILQGVLLSLEQGKWGKYEDVVISSAERHILLRMIDEGAFQVLITSRESDPGESLEVMANVEGAIGAALR